MQKEGLGWGDKGEGVGVSYTWGLCKQNSTESRLAWRLKHRARSRENGPRTRSNGSGTASSRFHTGFFASSPSHFLAHILAALSSLSLSLCPCFFFLSVVFSAYNRALLSTSSRSSFSSAVACYCSPLEFTGPDAILRLRRIQREERSLFSLYSYRSLPTLTMRNRDERKHERNNNGMLYCDDCLLTVRNKRDKSRITTFRIISFRQTSNFSFFSFSYSIVSNVHITRPLNIPIFHSPKSWIHA